MPTSTRGNALSSVAEITLLVISAQKSFGAIQHLSYSIPLELVATANDLPNISSNGR